MASREPSPVLVRAALIKKLEESLLTTGDAKKLQLQVLTRAQASALKVLPFVGVRIPYFDLQGKPLKFFRVRYLEETRDEWTAKTSKKPLRYSQPPNTGVELYVPPLIQWDKIIAKPEVQIIITEGELKAACACKAELPAVALGGVWSFRAKHIGEVSLPVFDKMNLRERKIFVVFDSDVLTNPDVQRAELALCRALVNYGAQPYIVRLPQLEQGFKTGLDDYLVKHGADKMLKLMSAAEPFERGAVLHRLNTEVAYVRNPGMIARLEDMQRMTADAFKSHAYSTWMYPEEIVGKDGTTTTKEAPAAPAWLRWPSRFEVQSMTYAPGEERFTAKGELNTWPGWATDPVRGDTSLWSALLDHIFKGEAAARKWFEQWCAYPVQNPGAKMYSAAVIWGIEHGTGKSLIGNIIREVYGRHNATEIEDQHLESTHNEWAENKQFVMADDVTTGENKRKMAERLRSMITRREIRLNPKYVPSYTVPDCINYYFTGNHPDLFIIEDDDRRMFVHEVTSGKLPREFYERCDVWLHGAECAASMFYHLLHVDLTGFNPRAEALRTDSKLEMIEDMRSDLGAWVRSAVAQPDAILGKGTGDLWTSQELLAIYDTGGTKRTTASTLGRELKRARVPRPQNRVVATKFGSVRLAIFRNVKHWINATHTECARHYEQSRTNPVGIMTASVRVKPKYTKPDGRGK